MRAIFALGLALGAAGGLVGCPGGSTSTAKQGGKPPPPTEIKVDLPEIPAKIEVTKSAPTDGNAPAKRSPLLDILKAENERQMAALRTQNEPAHYLAYSSSSSAWSTSRPRVAR